MLEAGLQTLSISADIPSIPIINASPTAGWVASEGGNATSSEPTFGTVALVPRTASLTLQMSRRFLKQGGFAADDMVRRELANALGRLLDAGVLDAEGTSGAITGIASTSGIVAPSGTSPSFATIADTVRQLLAAGARLANLRCICGTQTWETLTARERAAGSGYIIQNGRLEGLGIPVLVSAEATTDSIYIDDFGAATLARWGDALVLTDPRVAASDTVRVTLLIELALAVRYLGQFAVATSVTR